MTLPTPTSTIPSMVRRNKGRKVALVAGLALVVLSVVVVWMYWKEIGFFLNFERLGLNEQGYPEYRHRQTGIVTVRLPGGIATLGEPLSLHSQRKVTLPSFLIGKFEISQAEWKRVMGQNPSRHPGDNLPVDSVSWEDCQQFCRRTGFTLPTSDEWEYACRAGTTTRFAFGDSLTPDQANFDPTKTGGLARAKPVPVDSFQPNAFGLYNMHGNVWEWCQDDPYKDAGFSFAAGLRGGSWKHPADYCRSAFRDRGMPSTRSVNLGFRVAWSLP